MSEEWIDLGPSGDFKKSPVTEARLGKTRVAISWSGGAFGAVSGVCNHTGGPLAQGTLDGDYLTCPWHYWKFHRCTGQGEPGFEEDAVPSYDVREENGRLLVRREPSTKRSKKPHDPHPLARKVERAVGAIRVVGISTTMMDTEHPRYSTSEALLQTALDHAASDLGCETRSIRLAELAFRPGKIGDREIGDRLLNTKFRIE